MERDILPWLQQPLEGEQQNNGDGFRVDDDEYLASFTSMLEVEWYMNNIPPRSEQVVPNFQIQNPQQNFVCPPSDPTAAVLMQPFGSSSFLPPPNSGFSDPLSSSTISSSNNSSSNNNSPFGSVFNLESQSGGLTPFQFQGNQMDLSTQTGQLSHFPDTSATGFVPIGLQEGSSFGGSGFSNSLSIPQFTSKIGKGGNGEVDGGFMNYYESNEGVDIGKMENNGNDGGYDNEDEDIVDEVDRKGKKKEKPSKSLLAERRRRRKLGERLRTLRSVVPNISKMDKASILGDAVDYLNELHKKINDLQSELESSSSGSSLAPSTSTIPVQVKEELYHSNVSNPRNQSAMIEVRQMEGGTFSIHMYCPYKPGVLLFTMKAFDILGLDIHQAVISCFNGFTLDVFKAEENRHGQRVHPEQIKAVLLNAVNYHMA